ncbi:hypothetical protein GCM10020254_20580 [Streptomyces goshikiensis]
MNQSPTIELNNGTLMPRLGLGVWQVPDAEAERVVGTALEAGYRSIDTAAAYGNEEGTGRAIARSGVPRAELFVTTKLWNVKTRSWDRDGVLRAFDASLGRLGLDRLDLYLIHWPRPMRDDFLTIWRTFEEIAASGRARAVGVSNFRPQDLERLAEVSALVPAVNQIELHPLFPQAELRAARAAGHRHRGLVPAGPGQGAALAAGRHGGRRQARPDGRAGGAALAPAPRHGRDPEVGDPGADPGESRRVRLRAGRGGPGRAGRAGLRAEGPAARAGPGRVRHLRSGSRVNPPDGPYRVRNVASGLLLQVEAGNRVGVGPAGPPVPAAAQQWLISPVHSGGGLFHLVSAHNGKRLDVANASTDSGTRVQVWKANAFGAQEWIVEEHLDAPGVVSLIAAISGLPLEADEEGRARQCEDSDAPSQWWRLEPL